jgi:hypothetical protein
MKDPMILIDPVIAKCIICFCLVLTGVLGALNYNLSFIWLIFAAIYVFVKTND